MSFRFTVPPGNSAFVIPMDSTRGPANLSYASIAAGSSYLAPGPWRGKLVPAIVRYSIKSTTENVTLDEQVLTGVAGTSADWESQGTDGTAQTITAGTTAIREFKPLGHDWRLLITAGATGPTALVVVGELIFSSSYGG
jgi:hypothetical protein